MNRRVGDSATQSLTLSNTAASGSFSEALNASFTGATGNAGHNGGSINNLAAGSSNVGSMSVTMDTSTAGAKAGSVVLGYQTDGTGSNGNSGLSAVAAGSQTIIVSGNVYTAAVGQLNNPAVNFGVVRIGDVVGPRNITVQNTAAASALNDTLQANLTVVGGPFGSANSVGGIAAGASGNVAVSLATGTAGIFTQNRTVSFLSHNGEMADVSAGPDAQVVVTAQVNNYANAAFSLVSGLGALTHIGTDWFLDLGNIVLNSSISRSLHLSNDVAGPADTLGGQFALIDNNDFALSGWGPVSGLEAGQSSGNLDLGFDALSLGSFQDLIDFDGFGTNASDANSSTPFGVAQHRTLTIRANVVVANAEIPEPGTLALMLLAAAGAILARRRRIMAH